MSELIKRNQIGFRDFGWLQARHHFSFGDYVDENRMGLGCLRVWNDDEIAAKTGFDTHPHRNMEIITYIRQGAITHQDSLGNVGITRSGEIQVMSAGKGIFHSEHNLESEQTRLFQIWFMPRVSGGEPWWESRQFPTISNGQFKTIATGFPHEKHGDNAIWIEANASLKAGRFNANESITLPAISNVIRYIVVDYGQIHWQGQTMEAGDSLSLDVNETAVLQCHHETNLVMAEMMVV